MGAVLSGNIVTELLLFRRLNGVIWFPDISSTLIIKYTLLVIFSTCFSILLSLLDSNTNTLSAASCGYISVELKSWYPDSLIPPEILNVEIFTISEKYNTINPSFKSITSSVKSGGCISRICNT